jgi:hypothetical protein
MSGQMVIMKVQKLLKKLNIMYYSSGAQPHPCYVSLSPSQKHDASELI